MFLSSKIYRILIIYLIIEEATSSLANWKRVECKAMDHVYADIVKCYIKPIKRNLAALNVFVHLLKKPLKELSVNVRFMKRANGWKPFLYAFTIDCCHFLSAGIKNPVVKFFYQYVGLQTHSNLNHSCPINHDILLTNHTLQDTLELSNNLPLPEGEYAVFTSWIAGGTTRVTVNLYFYIHE